MLAFGLSKKLCNDFLKKQAVIGNLNEGKALKEKFNLKTLDQSLLLFAYLVLLDVKLLHV